ncbi:hypothetical protein VNO78_14308 [Psophocarpus tetragonolobus]|uniref:Glycosyltransferase n=1 Tax=Psophocarpus tetragonolobus TaxID=3891 RepID=A0AAN9XQB5_PSOTE
MGEREGEGEGEAVLFPFMAQGHIIPFIALAIELEKRKKYKKITIVNTCLNIKKIRSAIPENSSISLAEIPFNPAHHGLPPNTENTDNIPYNLVIRLIEASTTLKPAFTQLLLNIISQHKRKLIIIADIFFGWTASVAKELAVFHVIFSGCAGYGLACYYSLWLNLPHRHLHLQSNHQHFSLPDFPEARPIHLTQLPANISEADGTDAWSLFQQKNLTDWAYSDGLLFNTVQDLDSIGLAYFKRKLGLPAWPIGPLLLSAGSRGKGGGINPKLCTEWLNSKPSKSVLFVCFGSMNTISAPQMMQLGKALERSGKNFVWVVRPPIGFDINSEFRDEWLPLGFVERVRESGKGFIVHDWAPQVEILSHFAVSAFLSHCGWNSVLESLSAGVPLLGWPMAAEQFYNCKLLEEELGICVEVARGKSCEVKHEDIVAKIDLVMNETNEGIMMRKKAGDVRDLIRDAVTVRDEDGFKGSSVRAMDDFLSAAHSSNKLH